MDYNTLTAQILSYANRNEAAFVAQVPNIINQAMSRVYSEARCLGFQRVVGANMVIGNNTIIKPQDFREPVSLQYTIPGTSPYTTFALERTYEFCVTYSPNAATLGPPLFYSTDITVPTNNVAQSQLYLAPTPDMTYAYQLTYLTFPPIFNAQNSQNYLTDRYPNLLLYACMVESIPYLKSDERIPVFESLYNRALQAVNKDTEGRYTDRTTQRNKD
jgi:hypothetical protein